VNYDLYKAYPEANRFLVKNLMIEEEKVSSVPLEFYFEKYFYEEKLRSENTKINSSVEVVIELKDFETNSKDKTIKRKENLDETIAA